MHKARPLVSVIIPCYNVSAFVEEAIKSILCQTYLNLEIWIIDDASTDNTLKKIKNFKDDRIKVVSFKENTQKIGAVNDVLKMVNGEFIAFQDSDDFSTPYRIEEQIEQFTHDKDLGICFTNFSYIGSQAIKLQNIPLSNEDLKNEFLNFRNSDSIKTSATVCPSMMISRAALLKTSGYHPYFKGRVAEDIQWIYRILKEYKGVAINKVLYNYRIREGSFTQIQLTGKNAKYAYSWHLLSKIIYNDVYKNIDLLLPENILLLKEIELQACEEALLENIQNLILQKNKYEKSNSFLIGKFFLTPLRIFKFLTLKLKRNNI